MTTINQQIKAFCKAHGVFLHCNAYGDSIDWHAVQCRPTIGDSATMFANDTRSSAGHPTIEAAIDGVINAEWELAK